MLSLLIFSAIVALIVLAVASAYSYMKNAFSYWEKRGIPYMKPSLPFGNFGKQFMQKLSMADMVAEHYYSTNEPVLGVYVASNPALLLRDPKIIQHIFVKDFSSFYDRGTPMNKDTDPMSDNLFTQRGGHWKQNRTQLSPTFTSTKLKGMFDTIVECGTSLTKYMEQFDSSNKTIEMHDALARFTVTVFASIGFGIDIDCIANPKADFYSNGNRFFDPTIINAMRFNLSLLFPKLHEILQMRFIDEQVGKFMVAVVKQAVDYREKADVTRKDFFQMLMQNIDKVKLKDDNWSENMSEEEKLKILEEMSAQATVFFLASFESSATTMSFCLYELAKNLNVQSKVHEEIVDILARHDGNLTYQSMGEMKYLDECINETLRLHAPFGFLTRQCIKEYKIPDSDIVLEKGTLVVCPVGALHVDPKYYEEPEKFIPERFEHKTPFVEMPYLPFGVGPRNCIGYRLGKLQMKIALVMLLQKMRFELGEQHVNKEFEIDPRCIAKRPIGGINLKVKCY